MHPILSSGVCRASYLVIGLMPLYHCVANKTSNYELRYLAYSASVSYHRLRLNGVGKRITFCGSANDTKIDASSPRLTLLELFSSSLLFDLELPPYLFSD